MKTLCNALALAGAILVLAGCASTATSPTSSPTLAGAQPAPPTHCVRETGTRIPRKETCAAGRAYTGEEIRNTGVLSVGEALELLGL